MVIINMYFLRGGGTSRKKIPAPPACGDSEFLLCLLLVLVLALVLLLLVCTGVLLVLERLSWSDGFVTLASACCSLHYHHLSIYLSI